MNHGRLLIGQCGTLLECQIETGSTVGGAAIVVAAAATSSTPGRTGFDSYLLSPTSSGLLIVLSQLDHYVVRLQQEQVARVAG